MWPWLGTSTTKNNQHPKHTHHGARMHSGPGKDRASQHPCMSENTDVLPSYFTATQANSSILVAGLPASVSETMCVLPTTPCCRGCPECSAEDVVPDRQSTALLWLQGDFFLQLPATHPACAKAPCWVGGLGGQLLWSCAAEGLGCAGPRAVHAKRLLFMLL